MARQHDWASLRASIIGLGEQSSRKTFYPALREREAQLDETREDLRRSVENLSSVLHSMHDAIVIHDWEGRILEINDATLRMFRLTRAQALASRVHDLSAGDDVAHRLDAHWQRLRLQGDVVFEWTARRPADESTFAVEVGLRPARWYGQDVVVAVLRDITERKRLEAMLAQSQKLDALGQLAGGVAHDTANMLGVILGYVEVILEEPGLSTQARDDLGQVRGAALRCTELTRQLLAFARKQPVAPRAVDLNQATEGTLKLLRRLIGEHIELVWRPGAELPLIWMDPGQLAQVLANLAVNARDAMHGPGTLSLESALCHVDAAFCASHPEATPGHYVRLSVGDTGEGMTEDVKRRIFEPFFTTKGPGRGTGLGLATVYGIVRQSGGFLSVDSEVGAGTTFRVHLPVPAEEATVEVEVPVEPAITARGETILVAEDEPSLLKLARRLLEEAGYRVLAASRPSEAVAQLEAHGDRVDLLLTDLVMPESSGQTLYARLHARRPELRVLFMSGHPVDTIAQQGGLDDGAGFLAKPFSRADLLRRVRLALEGTPPEPGPGRGGRVA